MNRTLLLGALVAATAFSPERNLPAVPAGSRSLVVPGIVRGWGWEDGLSPLPLTPSLGEREQQAAPLDQSPCVRFADRLPTFLPLPRGEGRAFGHSGLVNPKGCQKVAGGRRG